MCAKQFVDHHQLDKHKESVHGESINYCGYQCDVKNPFDLRAHKLAKFCGVMLKCELCDKQFVDHHQLDKHKESIHGESINYCYLDIHEGVLLKCELCAKEFVDHHQLDKHKESVHGEGVDCDVGFQSPFDLRAHRLAKFCGECGKSFNVNNHLRLRIEWEHCNAKCLDVLDNQVALEDVVEHPREMETVGSSYTVVDEITKGVTDVEERLARTGAGGRLKRKKDKSQKLGASGQFNLITKVFVGLVLCLRSACIARIGYDHLMNSLFQVEVFLITKNSTLSQTSKPLLSDTLGDLIHNSIRTPNSLYNNIFLIVHNIQVFDLCLYIPFVF